MRNVITILLFYLPIIAIGQKSNELQSLNWLIGQWKGKIGGADISETWTKLNDQTMQGLGITIVRGDTVVKENLQLHIMGNHLGYIASPNNAPPVFFTLIEMNPGKWVFENKEHDFPQRIIYERKGENEFQAKIEGVNSKGEKAGQEFSFKRVE